MKVRFMLCVGENETLITFRAIRVIKKLQYRHLGKGQMGQCPGSHGTPRLSPENWRIKSFMGTLCVKYATFLA